MSEARARLNALPDRYPQFFSAGSSTEFAVGDGWSELLVTLFARIDSILSRVPGAQLRVSEIKQKFGTLRFYFDLCGAESSLLDEILDAVDLAEDASGHICELCGRQGKAGSRWGYISTLCAACRAQSDEKRGI